MNRDGRNPSTDVVPWDSYVGCAAASRLYSISDKRLSVCLPLTQPSPTVFETTPSPNSRPILVSSTNRNCLKHPPNCNYWHGSTSIYQLLSPFCHLILVIRRLKPQIQIQVKSPSKSQISLSCTIRLQVQVFCIRRDSGRCRCRSDESQYTSW